MRKVIPLSLITVALIVNSRRATGDAIMVVKAMKATTILEAFLEESKLRVEIEMGLADAPAFANLLPDEIHRKMPVPPKPLAERLKQFFARDLVFEADGKALTGRLVKAEVRDKIQRDEISGEPLPVPKESAEPAIFFVLEYPLATKPKTIRFKPPDQASPGASAY